MPALRSLFPPDQRHTRLLAERRLDFLRGRIRVRKLAVGALAFKLADQLVNLHCVGLGQLLARSQLGEFESRLVARVLIGGRRSRSGQDRYGEKRRDGERCFRWGRNERMSF